LHELVFLDERAVVGVLACGGLRDQERLVGRAGERGGPGDPEPHRLVVDLFTPGRDHALKLRQRLEARGRGDPARGVHAHAAVVLELDLAQLGAQGRFVA